MRIASTSEDKIIEKRIAITPEIAKKYIALGFELSLSENYGQHLGFADNEYKELGVKISIDEKESSVNITATLTSAFCPFADQITEDMQKAGYTKDGNVLSVNVDITFDPPFTMDSVSDEAKLMMGW